MNRNLLLSALFLISMMQVAWGQIPLTISYQGVLTDADGYGEWKPRLRRCGGAVP